MTDMRRGRLLQGGNADHTRITLSFRVAHMSPSSSGRGRSVIPLGRWLCRPHVANTQSRALTSPAFFRRSRRAPCGCRRWQREGSASSCP